MESVCGWSSSEILPVHREDSAVDRRTVSKICSIVACKLPSFFNESACVRTSKSAHACPAQLLKALELRTRKWSSSGS